MPLVPTGRAYRMCQQSTLWNPPQRISSEYWLTWAAASYHINFASSVPRPLLEELAKGTLWANAARFQIVRSSTSSALLMVSYQS
eukprot:6451735-Amphidinium_carterae.1